MNVQPGLQMDKAAFLAWVQGREEHYELAEGRVLMMTGGTARHALVVGNLFELLRARLDRKRWRVITEFVVDRSGLKGKDLTTKAPAFVAEVLSPSTTTTDLGDKAAEYLRLPSLYAYIVLAQDEVKAWAYSRSSNQLPAPQVLSGPDTALGIPGLGIDLPLADIYADIEFD